MPGVRYTATTKALYHPPNRACSANPTKLTKIYAVWYYPIMNEVQKRIAVLRELGWTLAAIADELEVTVNAVEKWQAGHRVPSNLRSTLEHLDRLAKRRRIPKRRRYHPGARANNAIL